VLWRGQTQNRENNPMQSRTAHEKEPACAATAPRIAAGVVVRIPYKVRPDLILRDCETIDAVIPGTNAERSPVRCEHLRASKDAVPLPHFPRTPA
jgi:hypothetical protein